MTVNELTGLPIIEEGEASPEIAAMYAEIKREMHLPFVPNIYKSVAVSPGMLQTYWTLSKALYQHMSLPEALVSIVFYAVAHSNQCQYCSANHEMNCRLMGIDEGILQSVANDLDKVSPERVRAMVEFALLVAHDPKSVSLEEYDRLRQYGLTDSEIVELVFLAGLGNMGDIMADSLKVEVDTATREALAR